MRFMVLALAAACAAFTCASQDVTTTELCSKYNSCRTCREQVHCGWCFHKNQCSSRSDCQETAQAPWITGTGRCPTATQVSPHQLQRTLVVNLDLTIEDLPSIDGQLLCVFKAGNSILATNATRTSKGVSCKTPGTDSIPPSPAGEHHLVSQLSVRAAPAQGAGAGADVAATEITFFDCSGHSSCTQCVSSPFPCGWCLDRNYCTHDTNENCRNDIIVSGIHGSGTDYRVGPGFCPRIDSTTAGDGRNEIMIPDGTRKGVRVKVQIIGQFIAQTRFICRFTFEGHMYSVMAQLLADIVYCDAFDFKYTSSAVNTTASFSVVWGGIKTIDNPNNVHIVMYRCEEMASDEETCLTLPEKYKCGWCRGGTGSCQVQELCQLEWLDRRSRGQS